MENWMFKDEKLKVKWKFRVETLNPEGLAERFISYLVNLRICEVKVEKQKNRDRTPSA